MRNFFFIKVYAFNSANGYVCKFHRSGRLSAAVSAMSWAHSAVHPKAQQALAINLFTFFILFVWLLVILCAK